MKMKLFSALILALTLVTLFSSCASVSNGGLHMHNGTEHTSGESEGLAIDSLGPYFALPNDGHTHTPVTDPAVEPTCAKEGKTEGSHCSLCGLILVPQQSIPKKKEHNYGVYPAYDSTCSEEGRTEGYGCLDCGLMVIHQGIISKKNHTPTYIPQKNPTCSEEGYTDSTVCSRCGFVFVESHVISKLPHTPVNDPPVAPDCTNDGKTAGIHCSKCGEIIKAQEVVPKDETKHKFVRTTEKNPTGRKPGATVGISCSACNMVFLESKEIPALGHTDYRAYEGSFGYYFLSVLDGGKELCALYDSIDASMSRFHNDTSVDVESNNIVAVIDYGALDLTSAQAVTVWTVYRADHPLYYWISNAVGYSSSQITVYTSDEFRLGSAREKYNEAIYEGVLEISNSIPLDADAYDIVKTVHDRIVLGMDYAYMENGEPEEAIWAHSVVGFFVNKAGVCETYAKVFQLMLNYLDVESIYVTGDAGKVKHAWNLVQMDDGQWYWFDLTWDDTPGIGPGFNYNYFAVTDKQPIGFSDFTTTHTYQASTEYDVSFMYTIPKRSEFVYVKKEDRLPEKIIRLEDNLWQIDPDIKLGDIENVTKISLGNFDDMTVRDYLDHLSLSIFSFTEKQLIIGKARVTVKAENGRITSVTMSRISY